MYAFFVKSKWHIAHASIHSQEISQLIITKEELSSIVSLGVPLKGLSMKQVCQLGIWFSFLRIFRRAYAEKSVLCSCLFLHNCTKYQPTDYDVVSTSLETRIVQYPVPSMGEQFSHHPAPIFYELSPALLAIFEGLLLIILEIYRD